MREEEGHGQLLEAEKVKDTDFSHRASRKEYGPANTLIFAQWDPMLEFCPLELYDNKFYCLSH